MGSFARKIAGNLQKALKIWAKKIPPYVSHQAVMIGVESRTSAPVRIPRDLDSLEHTSIKGLYPCGEGAGYAGGIISAAIDGMRCAKKIAEKLAPKQ